MKLRKTLVAALIGTALGIGTTLVVAQPSDYGYGPGYGMGPGMMYGYGMGPGMMYGYGHGYGMGPGMMYGYGSGMGPGMMYGNGYGPGYGAGAELNLTDEQRGKIAKIQQDMRSKQWDLMGKVRDEYARRAEAPDDAAANKADDQIGQLQQQMVSNATAARKEMDAVLTKEQRQQLRRTGY